MENEKMTNDEAIYWLEKISIATLASSDSAYEIGRAIAIAIEAINYRTATPLERDGRYSWCPICKSDIPSGTRNYCTICGQRLDRRFIP